MQRTFVGLSCLVGLTVVLVHRYGAALTASSTPPSPRSAEKRAHTNGHAQPASLPPALPYPYPAHPAPPAVPEAERKANLAKMSSKGEKDARRARFVGTWAPIRDEILAFFAGEHMPAEAVEWYKASLDYNVPGGKLNRGMSVCDTAEILKGAPLSEDEYKRAAVLGWCIELLQGFFLVSDDMMDASITRRGQPCWYRQPNVGMLAINDSFMLEAPIYWLLRKYFRRDACYADLVDLFHATTFQTEMGQLVDLITAPEDQVDLGKFSLDRHRLIVIYKTAYYSFYLPVACAMMLAGIPYPDTVFGGAAPGREPRFDFARGGFGGVDAPGAADPYTVALSILIPLGEYFQVQDDYLDWSAPPEVLGKIGTDIVDNKCSWVVNTALLLLAPAATAPTTPFAARPLPESPADPRAGALGVFPPARKAALRKVLDENYAVKQQNGAGVNEAEARVKALYRELDIPRWYKAYEDGVVGEIRRRIARVDERPVAEGGSGLRREVFESFLGKIYGRSK